MIIIRARHKGLELYWVERFFLTQGLQSSAQGFAGFDSYRVEFFFEAGFELYWVEFFFDAGFAVFCAGFRWV